MFDDLKAHFVEHVVGAYQAYLEVRTDGVYGASRDLRAALTAATALFHFREYLPSGAGRSRRQMASVCPSYDLLGDIVNAAKHRILTKGKPTITTAESLREVVVITRYEDAAGEYSDVQKLVTVRLPDGSESDILPLLTEVLNFWGMELTREGLLETYQAFAQLPAPGSGYVTRQDASAIDLRIIRGVRFKKITRLLKYDSTLGRAVPMNLSGGRLSFTIHGLPTKLHLELVHHATGRSLHHSFDLTDTESQEIQALKSDPERVEYLKRFAVDREAEITSIIRDAEARDRSSKE